MRFSTATARADLQAFLDGYFTDRRQPQVMDAGCGGAVRVRLPSDAVLNGIDISPDSAARNKILSNIVIGDVQTYPLPRASFDLVICWELLEHIPRPLSALSNLMAAVRQDGVIVLAFPNRASLKGLVTRFSSHRLHVWLLRKFWGQKNAGRPGYAPFPTYLAQDLAPEKLQRFVESRGMETAFVRLYEGNRVATLRQRAPVLHALYQGLLGFMNTLTFHRSDFGSSDVLLVIRPGQGAASARWREAA